MFEHQEWHRIIHEQPGRMSVGDPALLDMLCFHAVWSVGGRRAAKTGEHPTSDIRHRGRVCANSNFISAGKRATQGCQNGWLTLHHVLFILKQITRLFFSLHHVILNHFENTIDWKEVLVYLSSSYLVYFPRHGLENTQIGIDFKLGPLAL